ncbi:MAG: proteasome assembly chaperone family protein [Nanoarchaeota archaeon]|nr:proteasome assembly chaperone family protein [Nanoarchaeota archaeon]
MDDVNIILKKEIRGRRPALIEGFSGVGLVGVIAAQYYAEKLGAELVGHIESPELPPMAILVDGEVRYPIRVYYSKKHNLIILGSEFPVPKSMGYKIAKKIGKWAKKKKVKEVVCLEGIKEIKVDGKSDVFCVTTNKKVEKKMKELGLRKLKNGIIVGVSAILLLECESQKIPATCLMSEAQSNFPDGVAAANIIEILNKMFGTKVDTKPLEKQAVKFEKQLKDFTKKMMTLKTKKKDGSVTMYG